MATAMSVLRKAWDHTYGGLLLLEGEPGIGKSALFSEIANQARLVGYTCASGKADQISRISPAAPLLLALRSGPRPLLSVDELSALSAQTSDPLVLLEALTSLIERLAQGCPLLIGIDDAQWSDPVTRFVLRSLPSRLAGSPVVWLFASRRGDGLVDDLKQPVFAPPVTQTIALQPLAAADIASMAHDVLNRDPSADLTRLLDGVGGNPFFATQILSGVVQTEAVDGSVVDIPTEFVLGVRRRLSELAPATVAVLRVAAVFGQPLPTEDAALLLPEYTPAEITDGLDEAVRGHLLTTDHSCRTVFRHDLIGEAIYADLTDRRRRELHLRCARHLRDTGGDPLTIAAHARAGISRGDEASAEVLAAAADSCAQYMPETAADLILAAFHALSPQQASWPTLGQRAVELLSLVQRCSEAIDIADLLVAHLDDETSGNIEIAVARALWLAGRWHDAVERSTRALERPGISSGLRARLTALQALALSRVEPAGIALGSAERALAAADRAGDDVARQLVWHAMAEIARNRGDHRQSLHHFRALRAASGPAYIGQEIVGLQYLDRFDDADVMLRTARKDMAIDKGTMFASLIYAQMSWDYSVARFDDAEAGGRTLHDVAVARGSRTCWIDSALLLSLIALQRGDIGQARLRVTEGLDPASPEDEHRALAVQLVRGLVTASEGKHDEAASLLSSLVFAACEERDPWPWKPGWMRALTHIGLAAADEKFTQEVRTLADLGQARNPGVPSLEGTALQVRGLIEQDLGLLQRAAEVLERSPRPTMRAGGYVDLGLALVRAGQETEGAAVLDRAGQIYHGVGAIGPLKVLQDAMRQAGVDSPRWLASRPRPGTGWASLTQAETKVALLIGSGYTNKAAAEELGISVNTIGTHLRSAFAKLGVRSRVQLTNTMYQEDAAPRG